MFYSTHSWIHGFCWEVWDSSYPYSCVGKASLSHPFAYFKIFCLSLVFCNLNMICLCTVFLVYSAWCSQRSWICGFLYVINFGKFSSSQFLLFIFSFSFSIIILYMLHFLKNCATALWCSASYHSHDSYHSHIPFIDESNKDILQFITIYI